MEFENQLNHESQNVQSQIITTKKVSILENEQL